jgi:peptide deformylase
VLRRRAEPVERIDGTVREVARRMVQLMHEAEGVGLAAPQVGLSWRLFVARGPGEEDPVEVFLNPELEQLPGELEDHEEGCLSLPGITAEIRRPAAVTMRALDLDGRPQDRRAEGMQARIWQHEIDHLNGVLIIDRMRAMDRIANRKPIKALESALKG